MKVGLLIVWADKLLILSAPLLPLLDRYAEPLRHCGGGGACGAVGVTAHPDLIVGAGPTRDQPSNE
jgi:hypothetical protein